MKVDKQKLQEYLDIVQKVARVEYRRIPAHMLDCEELVSIGVIAIQVLIKNKTPEQLEKYNAAYVATAVRWAMRNELRIRYKWYSLKHREEGEEEEEILYGESDAEAQKTRVRESIYETILSIDGLAAAASDNDSPFDFIKDTHAMPDENAEISELAKMIKEHKDSNNYSNTVSKFYYRKSVTLHSGCKLINLRKYFLYVYVRIKCHDRKCCS